MSTSRWTFQKYGEREGGSKYAEKLTASPSVHPSSPPEKAVIILINKRMQAAANVTFGTVAKFLLEPDTEERIAPVPPGLRKILSVHRTLARWYDGLTYSTRKDIADWITEVKSAKARQRRTEQMAERLLSVMEAEHELPPVLRLAFASDPVAYKGWQRMTAAQRRGHLFGIFYYRTPEAQGRRIEKMLKEARKKP